VSLCASRSPGLVPPGAVPAQRAVRLRQATPGERRFPRFRLRPSQGTTLPRDRPGVALPAAFFSLVSEAAWGPPRGPTPPCGRSRRDPTVNSRFGVGPGPDPIRRPVSRLRGASCLGCSGPRRGRLAASGRTRLPSGGLPPAPEPPAAGFHPRRSSRARALYTLVKALQPPCFWRQLARDMCTGYPPGSAPVLHRIVHQPRGEPQKCAPMQPPVAPPVRFTSLRGACRTPCSPHATARRS
jgi:hypothetical protein